MKKIIFLLFAVLFIVSCGDDPESGIVAAQGELNGACYPNKTCNDNLMCSEEKNICIKDPSIDGNDSENQLPDTDSGDTQTSDGEPSDGGDSAPDNDSEENGEAECGNGTKETGELCEKGEYVKCSEADSKYSNSNFALCNDFCNGWNTDNCDIPGSSTQPLASFPARTHELTYLYNGSDAFDGMENQEDELWTAALFNAAIDVNGSTYSIPNPQANVHWLAAYYDSAALYFYQSSFLCDENMNCQYATPGVVLGADLSSLSAGKELSIGISDEHKANMLIMDVMNDADCVMLVGYGTLTVDSVKIAAGSAGKFGFTTSKIGIYLPVATPEGDMSAEIENAGLKICK